MAGNTNPVTSLNKDSSRRGLTVVDHPDSLPNNYKHTRSATVKPRPSPKGWRVIRSSGFQIRDEVPARIHTKPTSSKGNCTIESTMSSH